MTIAQAYDKASNRLNTPAARIDAETLLRSVLGISRTKFLLQMNQPIDEDASRTYFAMIDRLASGEPLQYLTGETEFYGLEFYVNSSVLIPRPETEIMVEKAIEIGRTYSTPSIADVGCGSGAVAITLAKYFPQSKIIALDISRPALDLAGQNAMRHNLTNIEFIESDLLNAVANRHFDLICANLPYVSTPDSLNNRFEPHLALDGGRDGLDVIRRLIHQISTGDDKPEWLLLEFGTNQAAEIKSILEDYFPGSQTHMLRDLIPLDRVSVTHL
jgi:release factor glutamine methyltransferase